MNDFRFLEKVLYQYILHLEIGYASHLYNQLCSIATSKAGQQSLPDMYSWANQLINISDRARWLSGLDSGNFQRSPVPYIYGVYLAKKDEIISTQYNLPHKPRKYPRLEDPSESFVELGGALESRFQQWSALDEATFLGELVGAWLLSLPEKVVRAYIHQPENRRYIAQSKRMLEMADQSKLAEVDIIFFLERLLYASWEEFWNESIS